MKDFRRAVAQLFAPEQKTTGAKVKRNVVFSALRGFLVWPIPFLLIPFILAKIGTRGYGSWAVFLTIIGFTSLSDFGLGGTLTKYVAEHHATGNVGALKRVLDTGLMLYVILAVLVACVLGACSGWLVSLLFHGKTGASFHVLITLWYWMVAIVGINIIVIPFYSTLAGLQRMDLSNFLGAFNSLGFALLAVLFLCLGMGLAGLLYAAFINALLILVLAVAIFQRVLPGIRLNPLHSDRTEMKGLLAFSLQIYVTQTSVVIQNQIEKLYLAWFTGVVAVGWYNIAAEVALRVRRIPELLLTPIMAAASELHAQRDENRLEELYYRAHKYLAFVGVPIVAYVAVASKRLVSLWIGPKLDLVALPLAILVVMHYFNLTSGPGFLILVGKGILKPGIYSACLGIVLNLTLSFVLIYLCGFSGAVIGVAIATGIATVFFISLFNRTSLNRRRSIRDAYMKPVVCSSILVALLAALHPFRRLDWFGLIIIGLIFGSVYLLALIFARFFDQFDLATAQRYFPMLRIVRRIIPIA
jgi:O-antigen/teichoic acid export membrane protein